MKFKATDDQVRQIMANAVNAASPMGLGFLQATNKQFTAEDFKDANIERIASLDYVQGRMVKLTLWHRGDFWEAPENNPRGDYQSWVRQYPTYEDLLLSVPGVEVLDA